MLTIIRCNKDLIEDGILARAKENLRKFPTLHSIFEKFDDPRFSNYQNKNIVFVKCMMSNGDSLNFLLRIENALCNLVSHGKLTIKRHGQLNKKFINRITSSIPSEFLPVISEVLVADYLLSLLGPDNFRYEKGTKAETKPDFEITANARKYSLELRTLMKGTTGEKIEAIFDKLCMHILNLLKRKTRGCNLVARLDTLNLCKNQDKQIDVQLSNEYLVSYFDRLDFLSLVGNEITIDFEYIRRSFYLNGDNRGEKAAKALENRSYSEIITFDQNNSVAHSSIGDWLHRTEMQDLINCPFDTLSMTNNPETSCVSVSPIDIDAGDTSSTIPGIAASEMSKTSFIAQIKAALKDKYKSGQRREGEPAIVVLDAFEWNFNYFEYDGFLRLKKLIQEELKKYKDISGIIIYYDIKFGNELYGFYDGRYIENKDCEPAIRVTTDELQKAKIIRKYNDPLLTMDKSIDFHSLNEIQQVARIIELINLESNLILTDDKIELLNNISSLLNKREIDEEIMVRLEPVIKKYCNDPDPQGPEVGIDMGKPDLSPITPPTVISVAAACQLKLTKHNPTSENIDLSVKLYGDSNTLVREAVCSNLIFLSNADFREGFTIAKQIICDNWRVRFHLDYYLRYALNKHQEEAFELCKEIVEKFRWEDPKRREKDAALESAISILTNMAMRADASKFKNYFEKILNDRSYPIEVKQIIAFTCKSDELLFNEKFTDTILNVYTELVKHQSGSIYEYASFHLFHSLIEKRKPFLSKISPLLELLSFKKYDPTYPFWLSGSILNYLTAFYMEIPSEQSISYLERVCANKQFLIQEGSESWKVYRLIESLCEQMMSSESKNKLRSIVIMLIESKTPHADMLLRKLDGKS